MGDFAQVVSLVTGQQFVLTISKWKVKVTQLCLVLCDPLDGSPPGSSVRGILQARILERVAMPSSRGSSWARDRTWATCIADRFFTVWATRDTLMASLSSAPSSLMPVCRFRPGLTTLLLPQRLAGHFLHPVCCVETVLAPVYLSKPSIHLQEEILYNVVSLGYTQCLAGSSWTKMKLWL